MIRSTLLSGITGSPPPLRKLGCGQHADGGYISGEQHHRAGGGAAVLWGPGPAHYRQDVFQARHLEEALALQIKANMCICAFSAVGD